jgi:hypothetical protein
MQLMINERVSLPNMRLAFYWLRIGRLSETDFRHSSNYLYELFRVFNCSFIGTLPGNMLRVFACAWHGPAIRMVPRCVPLYAQATSLLPAALFDNRHVLHLSPTAHPHSFPTLYRLRLAPDTSRRFILGPHPPLSAIMFNWLRRNKSPSTAQIKEDHPPQIRKPQHAYRDARMSIPIGEREFYDIIQARKRSSLASSVEGGKWKGKARLHSGESSLVYAISRGTAAALIEVRVC